MATTGNVTRAAEQLGRTQSAVTVCIRRLERALKVSLFERAARGITLTPAGEELLPRALRVLDQIEGS